MDKRVNPISPSAQIDLGFGSDPEQLQRKKPAAKGYKEIHEKHNPSEKDSKGKAAENKEFEDKRAKSSPLIRQAAINDMKQMLNMAGAASDLEKGMMGSRLKKPNYKSGGKVVKALKNAGFYDKGKTKSEREKIVSKVTTKPQRIGMVEKMFSAKKMKAGGMASARADGIAIRGRTRA